MKKVVAGAVALLIWIWGGVALASADPTVFDVGADTTVQEINAAIADPAINQIHFGQNKNLTGTINISSPTEIFVDKGVEVNLSGNAHKISRGFNVTSDLVFRNHGRVIVNEFKNYGIHVNGKANFTLIGDDLASSVFTVANNRGYGIDSQGQEGLFKVSNVSLFVLSPQEGKEGPMIFNQGVTQVTFENASVNVLKQNGVKPWRAAIYSEAPVEFIDSSLQSETASDYNLSIVNGAPLNILRSGISLHTSNNAEAKCNRLFFFTVCKPYVGLNTAGNTVTIQDSELRVETTGGSNPNAAHQSLQFQDANYIISNSHVYADSAGVDAKQTSGSTLKINGDSKVEIGAGNGASLDPRIVTTVDSGTVVLPPTTSGVINSGAEALTEFVSKATGGSISISDPYAYTYNVTKTSEDANKHVWAPAVNLRYFASCDASPASTPKSRKQLIRGTAVENDFNATTVEGGEWVVMGVSPEQAFYEATTATVEATTVLQDLDICPKPPQSTPEPTSETPEPTTEPSVEATVSSPEMTVEPSVEATVSSPEGTVSPTVSRPAGATLPVTGVSLQVGFAAIALLGLWGALSLSVARRSRARK
ncbi:hypothetical protein [Boudabousia marimammalium]|uniref:Gram-positive cocci surface proteins LPxTG domain-containing protein n=1 Tax=Boudabousia marimammalium TaxID=156892 RepID=A0A1Q5PNX7_9ACTO|nr:hypothetical protein [Boudabousia marimammalium]OKL49212.1 hypothetical protein BM477_04260 [Boudabousia marimammalium]